MATHWQPAKTSGSQPRAWSELEGTETPYQLEVELGRVLGMVIRGPLVDVLRGQLVTRGREN